MNIKHLTLLTIALSLFFFACETEKTEEVIELMPLAEGNFWEYEYHNHSYDFKDSSKTSIGEKMSILGHEGFLLGEDALIRSDEKGNTVAVVYFSEYDTIVLESAIYRQDIDLNESYEYHTVITSRSADGVIRVRRDTLTMNCIAQDTLLATPAGDFMCLVIENTPDNGGNIFRTYLSPGVGRIKSERFEDGKLFSTRTLFNYVVE